MLLSIIILNYQSYELTINCIESILSTQQDIDYRIIVVDDDSPNRSKEIIEKWIISSNPSVSLSLIKTLKNGGYSSALNFGIQEAIERGTEFIAILNNDLVFKKKYFSVLIKKAREKESIAFWGGSIKGINDGWQEAYKPYKSNVEFIFSKRPFSNLFIKRSQFKSITYSDSDDIIEFDGMVSGCCFMFRASLIEKIGLWDEKIYLYHEEDAIAAKLHRENLKCGVVPKASVIHLGSQTIGTGTPFQYYHRYISEIYVLKNYYNASRWQLFLLKIIDNIALMINIHDKKFRKAYRKSFNNYYKSLMNNQLD